MVVGTSKKEWDLRFVALAPGKRTSESGNIYYETRRNRSDESRRKRL